MEPSFLKAFPEFQVNPFSEEEDIAQGEKRKYIKPTSRNDPKLEALQTFFMDWINTTLKNEHIVVKSLEQDMYDGLILHHLIAIFRKDLLSTLHLLVAIAGHFQPELAIPPNVKVDVINVEHTANGFKTEDSVEYITGNREPDESSSQAEIFDELMAHAPEKVDAVKEVFLKFVNRHVGKLGLSVKDIDSQFADGVILLLLIGQLQGYFVNLGDFFLKPSSPAEMVHNASLAVDLLMDGGLLDVPINPEDLMNRDMKTTLLVLYCLFSKYKTKEA
uniref:gamma-parvin isoform X2 n=1 Tax=Podarcis muralis TaxID=64176 RepID=UPI00109FA8C9|nr:gamma-parvin isoform X2 [Podarcis muralis]